MTDAMKVKEALQLRHDEISKWLGHNAPYVVADQKHLDENTPERAYWHYGYKAALSDVLALAPSPAALDPVTKALRSLIFAVENQAKISMLSGLLERALKEAKAVIDPVERKPTQIKDFPGRAVDAHLKATGRLPNDGDRAALDPVTVEACATVAEKKIIENTCDGEDWCHVEGSNDAARNIAAAIRALIGQPAPTGNAPEQVRASLKELLRLFRDDFLSDEETIDGIFQEVAASASNPQEVGPAKLCSCKASERDGQHMMWCPVSSTVRAEQEHAALNALGCFDDAEIPREIQPLSWLKSMIDSAVERGPEPDCDDPGAYVEMVCEVKALYSSLKAIFDEVRPVSQTNSTSGSE
jgi:hypothetical protein